MSFLSALALLALGTPLSLSNPLPIPPPIDEEGRPLGACAALTSYDGSFDDTNHPTLTITAYTSTTTTSIAVPNCIKCPIQVEQDKSPNGGEKPVPETVTVAGTGVTTVTQTMCIARPPIPGPPLPKREEGSPRRREAGLQTPVPTLGPAPPLEPPPILSPPPVLSAPPVLSPPPSLSPPPPLTPAALLSDPPEFTYSPTSLACPTPIVVIPSLTVGPIRTVWTSTVTETSLVDCGGCSRLTTSTLGLGPGPAVIFEETVTAEEPSTTVDFACESGA